MSRTLRMLCAAIGASLALAAPAFARPAVGLNPAGTQLVMYDTAAPGTILERHDITGLQPGEAIMGIDVVPRRASSMRSG